MHNRPHSRFPELDLLRGLSIIAMVLYHAFWDLYYFDLASWDIFPFSPQIMAQIIGSSFLLINGMCLSISYARTIRAIGFKGIWKKFIIRGCKLLSWGAVITLVVYFALDEYILFGILHLIGVCILLSPLFLPRPNAALAVGVAVITADYLLTNLSVRSLFLLPFGLGRITIPMVDYYPLFPWFGVVLIGIWLGSVCYPHGERRFPVLALESINKLPGTQFVRFLGRHSLIVYLIHQPIVFGLVYLIHTLV